MSFWGTRPGYSTSAEAAELTAIFNLVGLGAGFAISKNADGSFAQISVSGGGVATVAQGGTGLSSMTAYAVLAGGTTSTGNLQQVSGLGSSGQVLTSNGPGALPTWQPASGGSGITVGTTTITSGTTTRILYDNAGVVGEYTLTGTGTVVAMQTSPSFTTPTLGAATATSINKMAITAPATSSTLAVADGKTFTVSNTITLAGTDSSTYTFPGSSATIARTDAANTFTGHQTIEGVTSTGATGTGKFVFDTSPTLSNPTVGTQTATDNSTLGASTAYVTTAISNALAGVQPQEAVQWATTTAGNTSGLTYNNGVSGVGATLTGANNTAVTIDGHTFVVGDVGVTRLLVKNDTQSPSGAFNGVYLFTALQTVGTGAIFTRALNYNTPSEMNNSGLIPVENGTANASTTWVQTATIATVGMTPLVFAQFSYSPTSVIAPTLGGTGVANNASSTIAISGSFGTTITVTATTAVTLPTSGTLVSTVTTGNGVSAVNTAGALAFTLGAITPSTVNGVTFTGSGSATLALGSKNLTVNNTITLAASADGNTFTFPNGSQGIAGLSANQTFVGQDKFNNFIDVNNAVTVSSNAGTVPVTFRLNTFTNSSAATMAITMATSSAVDGQISFVRIYDFSAVAQTIGWTNTENSSVGVPLTSNGSTTLFLTASFMFNGSTSKWRILDVS